MRTAGGSARRRSAGGPRGGGGGGGARGGGRAGGGGGCWRAVGGGSGAGEGGEQDVSVALRDQVLDLLHVVGAVEDQQPAAVGGTGAQRLVDGADAVAELLAGLQAEAGGEGGELLARGGAEARAHPPH